MTANRWIPRSFSSRALLAVVALLAVLCGVVASVLRNAQAEVLAAAEVESHARQVEWTCPDCDPSNYRTCAFEQRHPLWHAIWYDIRIINCSTSAANDTTCAVIAGARNLDHLDLGSTQVGDQGLASLRSLTQLTSLDIHSTRITGATFGTLRSLTHLEKLNIAHNRLSQGALLSLHAIENLRYLEVTVDSQSVADLSGLRRLQYLVLVYSSIRGHDLSTLFALRELEYLDVSRTDIGGDLPANMECFGNVGVLNCGWTQLNDRDLEHIARMPSLVHLDIGSTLVTDDGLVALANARSLKSVNTQPDTRISAKGVAELKRRRPDIDIQH